MDIRLAVLILIQPSVLGAYNTNSNTIGCTDATVVASEPSNITCFFHKDIKANKTSISVAMYRLDGSGVDRSTDVLQCSWTKTAEKPACLVSSGYTFNYIITNRLTVGISSTTPDFAGTYSCHVVPPDGATVVSCELSIAERPTGTSTPTSTATNKGLIFPEDRKADSADGIQIATLILVLVQFVFLVVVVCIYRKRSRSATP